MTKYKTITEASEAAKALGITTAKEYKERWKDDLKLVASPDMDYGDDWNGWEDFFKNKK